MMPRLDGLSAVMKIREKRNLPIIVLSAKSEDSDKVLGLSMGADDYIAKPFGMMELVARCGRCSAGPSRSRRPRTTGGDLFVSPQRHVVRVAGEEVALTNKEFELLCLLLEHQASP